jgi:hypothetical protein
VEVALQVSALGGKLEGLETTEVVDFDGVLDHLVEIYGGGAIDHHLNFIQHFLSVLRAEP